MRRRIWSTVMSFHLLRRGYTPEPALKSRCGTTADRLVRK